MGNGGDTMVEEVLPLGTRFYIKAKLIIDNSNKVSLLLCIWAGFVVSVDYIMKKFKVRYRFKNWKIIIL